MIVREAQKKGSQLQKKCSNHIACFVSCSKLNGLTQVLVVRLIKL